MKDFTCNERAVISAIDTKASVLKVIGEQDVQRLMKCIRSLEWRRESKSNPE